MSQIGRSNLQRLQMSSIKIKNCTYKVIFGVLEADLTAIFHSTLYRKTVRRHTKKITDELTEPEMQSLSKNSSNAVS